jgi:hypothetical protein
MAKTKSMQSKVTTALQAGKELTVAQIQKFGLARPHNAISVARKRGLNVVTTVKTVKNKSVTVYSLAQGV